MSRFRNFKNRFELLSVESASAIGFSLSLPFIPSSLPTTAWLSGTDIILSQWIL